MITFDAPPGYKCNQASFSIIPTEHRENKEIPDWIWKEGNVIAQINFEDGVVFVMVRCRKEIE